MPRAQHCHCPGCRASTAGWSRSGTEQRLLSPRFASRAGGTAAGRGGAGRIPGTAVSWGCGFPGGGGETGDVSWPGLTMALLRLQLKHRTVRSGAGCVQLLLPPPACLTRPCQAGPAVLAGEREEEGPSPSSPLLPSPRKSPHCSSFAPPSDAASKLLSTAGETAEGLAGLAWGRIFPDH